MNRLYQYQGRSLPSINRSSTPRHAVVSLEVEKGRKKSDSLGSHPRYFAIIPLLYDLTNGESALEGDVSSSRLLWITNGPFADFRAVLRAIHQSDIHDSRSRHYLSLYFYSRGIYTYSHMHIVEQSR